MTNAADKLLTMWDLYYCPDTVDFSTIPALTDTNQATVLAALAALNWTSVGHIKSFSVSHSLENEKEIRAGNCGVGELARYAQKTPKITFTRLDVNNRPAFDKLFGLDRLSVAGTPVTGATQVIASGFTYNKFYPISNQNGDWSAISITSVVWSTNGTLVPDVDYVKTNVNGVYGILIVDSTTVTTTSQTITITYNYTPSAYTLDGYNIAKEALPYGLFKFVSCKNPVSASLARRDTKYFWKYVLDGELVETYIDMVETDFEWVEASFVWVPWGGYLNQKETVSYP